MWSQVLLWRVFKTIWPFPCVSILLVDAASLMKCAESRVCEGVSQHTSEQVSPIVNQSSPSESTTTTTDKSESVDFQMVFQLEQFGYPVIVFSSSLRLHVL